MAVRAIFVDKDGTLIDNVADNVDPARIRLSHGAKTGMKLFARLGFKLIIVSNQAALASGRFNTAALQAAFEHLLQLLEPVRIDGIYVCPHAEDAACACRKPRPGMLVQAAQEHGIDLAASWMIGDILHDVEAGKRAGCRTVLIDNGNETEWELSDLRTPDLMAADLYCAAHLIRSR
jgi:D-glycero-D-manno-heptose 1,7-bisphosphate phosphatase